MAEILIKVGGVFSLAFAIFHALFWRIFNWKNDLRSLTWMNRSIMQVLNLCLMFAFIIFAYVSLFHTYEMLSMPLGKTLLVLIALFWLARAIEQVVFFKLNHWSSGAFLFIFLFGCIIYAISAYVAIY